MISHKRNEVKNNVFNRLNNRRNITICDFMRRIEFGIRIRYYILIILVIFILILVIFKDEASAKTITVSKNSSGDYDKIQDAIDNAIVGDTIRVFEGVYKENVVVNKSLTLIGNGTKNTTIDAEGNGIVVNISADHV